MFDNLIQGYLKSVEKGEFRKDIKFIPVSLNYDIVYEGETFPIDFLGESKIEESLMRFARQFTHFSKNLGKVIVKYGEPISLKEYISNHCQTK